MHFSDACSGHKLNADPEILGLKIDIHFLIQEVNVKITHLQDIWYAPERQYIARFYTVST